MGIRRETVSEQPTQVTHSLVHETAQVSPQATVGSGTRIWHFAQVREGASIGQSCIVGKGAYIGLDVQIGNNCKIQNACLVYHGATLGDGVFLGPAVVLTNDKHPRAVNADGSLKAGIDWTAGRILVHDGASLGAGTVVLLDVVIGRWAMIGAGSVVTADVPDYGLVWGNPARLRGFVCPCGGRLHKRQRSGDESDVVDMLCPDCGMQVAIPALTYGQTEGVE
jgi:acetyltransferase-like isoleucine patch superfamily enzyme